MMWIIIFILKILGILLAAVLALLVLALVYLLFAPVTYRVIGQRETNVGLEVAGYDLLRLVRVFVVYEKKQWRYGVRLLWGLVGKEKLRGDEDNEGDVEGNGDGGSDGSAEEAENGTVAMDGAGSDGGNDSSVDNNEADHNSETAYHTEAETDGGIDNSGRTAWHTETETTAGTASGLVEDDKIDDASAVNLSADDTESDIKLSSASKSETNNRQGKKTSKKNDKSKTEKDGHSSKTKNISDTDNIRNPHEPREPDDNITEPEPPRAIGAKRAKDEEPSRWEKLQKMLSHPGNQKAFSILWNGGTRLLYRVRPHFKKAEGSFSTGAPDTTGEVVGAIAMLPVAHGGNVHLNPDFESEKPYVTGIIDVYGRLQLWFAAVFAVRVIASKDCRRLYRQFRKL